MFIFSKDKRLLNKYEFDFVFNNAKKIHNQYFVVLIRQSEKNNARLGIIIAKKNVRLSVQRNRIKRLVRESFRLTPLPNFDVVIIAKNGIAAVENKCITRTLDEVWKKLITS